MAAPIKTKVKFKDRKKAFSLETIIVNGRYMTIKRLPKSGRKYLYIPWQRYMLILAESDDQWSSETRYCQLQRAVNEWLYWSNYKGITPVLYDTKCKTDIEPFRGVYGTIRSKWG